MGDAHAVVVLPPGAFGQIANHQQRRWLSRGTVTYAPPETDLLRSLLSILRVPQPVTGYAALRRWGQTGQRPEAWLCGADPVHLETRLRHLVVRAFRPGEVVAEDLAAIFADLTRHLGDAGDLEFSSIGESGYLASRTPFATAAVPADTADGRVPDDFTPTGERARLFHRLQGEVQMSLHALPINERRASRGQRAVNSLWFWGDGMAPEPQPLALPALRADDPLVRGFWLSAGVPIEAWDPDLRRVVGNNGSAAVYVVPDRADGSSSDALGGYLAALHDCLKRGDIEVLTAVFRDGLTVRLRRPELLRIWRNSSPLLRERDTDA